MQEGLIKKSQSNRLFWSPPLQPIADGGIPTLELRRWLNIRHLTLDT